MNQLWAALLIFLFIGGGVAVLTGGDSHHSSNDVEMCQ